MTTFIKCQSRVWEHYSMNMRIYLLLSGSQNCKIIKASKLRSEVSIDKPTMMRYNRNQHFSTEHGKSDVVMSPSVIGILKSIL